jgi:DNA-binding PadR family transcriptional regulator
MGRSGSIGELEQVVLLVLLQLGEDTTARRLRSELADSAGRNISRGALYRTLDRLGEKGLLEWELLEPTPERGGHPRRTFEVTPAGLAALRESRSTLMKLWSGLETVLEDQ